LGLDNLSRTGSWLNWDRLKKRGVQLRHADIRQASDLETLPPIDWVIDSAGIPSVLAGVDGQSSSRQLLEHNLLGTINTLEFCKRASAGLILLSTSRVYSIEPLAGLDVAVKEQRFVPVADQQWPAGVSANGVDETGSITAPVSLYGASKVASEALALEYSLTFNFPVWINRCGVLAGAGQFGRADQGIFGFWMNSWLRHQPLRYIGFGGSGYQVRDCLHPRDLAPALRRQMETSDNALPKICNFSGGLENSMSLAELSDWCARRFGRRTITAEATGRPYDIPWLVLNHSRARSVWHWEPRTKLADLLEEIARHAEANPDWLSLSSNQ
jgi:CDP-paratose 2-epimerase